MTAARGSVELATIPVAGDRIGERYLVESLIGQGATGVVYAAVHEYTGRAVAIKWLHPHVAADATNAQRFLREARAAAAVQHPNVVEILDAGRDRATFYLVMERLEGELLSALLARESVGVPAVARIFVSLCRGVAAAHALGIVHRDLKPENVFLARASTGRPAGAKVLDFGISKLKRAEGRELTEAGVFIGSPYYMAPEQIADSRAVDARADVYSLGVMLYEALSGRVPFDAESLSALFTKVVTEKAPPLDDLRPDLPAALCDVVARAMSPEPKERYPSVRELGEALEPFAQGMRFDPGGDAFELAWRERASSESLASVPPAAPVTGESDPASSALARARARGGSESLPEQPTVIRIRKDDDEASTDPVGGRGGPIAPPPARPVTPLSARPLLGRGTGDAPLAPSPTVMADPSAFAPMAPPALAPPALAPPALAPPPGLAPPPLLAPPPATPAKAPPQTVDVSLRSAWIALAAAALALALVLGVVIGRLL